MKNERFPIWEIVELDLQSLCNRNCNFCPRYNDRTGIRKDSTGRKINKKMPSEKVYSIIDELNNMGYKGRITFHRLSEPLLDSRYLEFVKYAVSRDLVVIDHTNGDILKKDDNLCKQLDGLVDTFVIGLYDYKNNSERKELESFWIRRFEKTKVQFSTPNEAPAIRQGSDLYNNVEKDKSILDLPCTRRLSGLLIRYDGEVSLCCEDDACEFELGNVFRQSIKDIWWSEKHINIVEDLQNAGSRHNYNLCSKCFKGYKKAIESEKPKFITKIRKLVKSIIFVKE